MGSYVAKGTNDRPNLTEYINTLQSKENCLDIER